ncbi:heme ABC transporter ATP-binding protein [Halopseudomonas aestusnigri]|jgi:iron complex transport system ATP-binding protein|uniref:heme ABC transporter ATP-binding protein n=1 Tax=Halopseudomonas TaxID=2901189 RepID=UPI000C4A7284|nr:heme ABC transporter ATP-binding protein [Halopseudomonas aestusnigri]MAH00158.1 heme ABC transporter ATP-binding protein [Pseudomonadales bacterium]MEE2800456.1 heme ABC transporter ATP-binding protein [Pseudomonadota bacterium]MAK74069.1 heme ABC transporter ATP-binding protein [Pseudomonadales bacterium]MAP76805.1 heme ABC transporter ATP-binding protein [Pseudomonadales bacterium]MAY08804.1 heme ABC transporter ATP-binding protein [Pseudomonadales bacterium]|tara:strand:- start:170 stop:934 length:765 start_codon:yes stop_codon:yes gene_type:complete
MLSVEQLGCSRGGRQVLRDLTFDLHAGEVIAVLGTNGAGKSTLLAALCGELAVDTGRVQLAGRNLDEWTAGERARRLAVLPQQSELAFPFRVEEVVALGCMPHATGLQQDRAICADAMAAADVTHLSQRSYLTLSGGERQRVHLARVLAQVWEVGEGGCLLLDEPTASLDLAHQRLIMQQARAMASRGLSVLVVLHDLNLAAAYADRVLLLHEGRLDALGTPWQVLQADHIERVFGVAVQVQRHPQHDCPLVIL